MHPVGLSKAFVFLLTFSITSASAAEYDLSAELGTRGRFFFETAPYSGQHSNQLNTSFDAKIEAYADYTNLLSDSDNLLLKITPRGRLDLDDDERNLFDLQEAKLDYQIGDLQFVLGIDKVFWGVTETRHLVDIINQTDGTEDIDNEEKLGQPMFNITYYSDGWGDLSLFYLPFFRELNYPGIDGRLRPSFVIDGDKAIYERDYDEKTPSYAARYTNVIGDFDLGLSHFSGLSREPVFTLNSALEIVPKYNYIEQTGLDLQYTNEGLLLKLEAISRGGHGHRFFAASGGFEYTFYNIDETGYDIGTLAEYHFDDRNEDIRVAPFAITNNDLFIGARVTANDENDSALLGGIMMDMDTQNTLFSAEYSQRLGGILSDNYKLELDARLYFINDKSGFENNFGNDNHIQASLKRFF